MSLFLLIIALVICVAMLAVREIRYRELKKSEHERKMMIALLSHRLRTPLTSVKWHTEMLLNQEFGKLQIAQMELLDKVNAGIADAIQVLNTFLETSRIERGDMDTRPVSLDVHKGILHVLEPLMKEIQDKNMIVQVEKNEERVLAYINPLVFHTILEVVLHNAVLYTPEKGTVRVEIGEHDGRVTIKISDSGVGISDDEKHKLFTKFYRSDKARIMSTSGNGLGLYLAKQMLDEVGGSIDFVSRERVGTTFFITLPKERKT